MATKQGFLIISTILNGDAVGTKHYREGGRLSGMAVKRGCIVLHSVYVLVAHAIIQVCT